MTISLKRIAETILNRRNSLSSGSIEADLKSKLSFAELQEAMRRNWVSVDPDFGTLSVSNLPSRLAELRVAAESNETGKAPVQESGHKHTPGRELMDGFLAASRPVYSNWISESDQEDHKIGDKVTVGQDGETFEGTISEKNANGEYKISFGDKKPKAEKTYKATEISKSEQPGNTTPKPSITATAGV